MFRNRDQNPDSLMLQGDHSVPRKYGGELPDRLLHGSCNASRGDGSRDHLRPAITGEKLEAEGVRPEWTLLDW